MSKKIIKIITLILLILLVVVGRAIIEEITCEDIKISDEIEEKDNLQISIHIDGEVKLPGVYTLDIGSRVDDAVKMAGGINKNGDLGRINLAEELIDGQKIVIPSKEDIINYGEATDSSKNTNNSESSILISSSNSTITIEMFNLMNEEELQTIPGIGPVLAKNIIDYKNSNGSFKSCDELIDVKGIGEKKLNKLKEFIK